MLLALVLLGATPPGRAAINWAAERVGIAEVGDEPTLSDRRQNGSAGFSTDDSTSDVESNFTQRGPAVVIGSGLAPGGPPYEVVGYRAPGATCISFEWPTIPRSEPSCTAVRIGEERLATFAVGPLAGGPADGLVVQGEAGVGIDRIELAYANQESGERGRVQARVFHLEGRLASRLNSPVEPMGAFVGFLPEGISARDLLLEIRAYDGRGRLVDTAASDAPAAEAERQEALRQGEQMREATISGLEDTLRIVQSEDLAADVDPEPAAATLQQAIAVDRGELELTRAEGNRLEEDMIELLSRLRAAGDIPGVGAG